MLFRFYRFFRNASALIFSILMFPLIFFRVIRDIYIGSRFKKVVVRRLMSARFGHFLAGTELMIREQDPGKYYIYLCQDVIDNKELLNIWKRQYIIYPKYYDLLYILTAKMLPSWEWRAWDITDCPKLEFLDSYYEKRAIRTLIAPQQFRGVKKKGLRIALTFKTPEYHQKFQGSRWAIPEFHRNTVVRCQEKFLLDLMQKNYELFNFSYSSPNFLDTRLDFLNRSLNYRSLETELKEALSCDFLIANGTGIDHALIMNDVPTLYPNAQLPSAHQAMLHTAPTIYVLQRWFDLAEGRYMSLKEHFELEDYFRNSGLGYMPSYELQSKFGFVVVPPSAESVRRGWEELKTFIKLGRESLLTERQKLFFELFPDTVGPSQSPYYKREHNSYCLISPSLLDEFDDEYFQ